MSNYLNSFYFVIIAIVSIFTGEIVTFIMLGIVVLALNNINTSLKKICKRLNQNEENNVESN